MKNILLLLTLFFTSLSFSQDPTDLLMESGTFNQCTGVFYDSGGEFGPYGNGENLVTTICSDVEGDFIQLEFTEFITQGGLNADVMNIYDGDDLTAPLIGSYDQNNSPGTVAASASNASGCLTIEFISSDSGYIDGWAANIECFTPCQTITASIDSTTPSAVSGTIEVDPGDLILFEGSAIFSEYDTGAVYTWDFGNGETLDGSFVNYAYPNPGTYTVTLTVTDTNPLGCSDSVSTIEVVVLDNDSCAGALPLCDDIYDVPSPVGTGSAEAGIDYGCLGSQPRPRWYFMQVDEVGGDLDFTLTQTTGEGGSGSGIDVDFIVWGPFTEPVCGSGNLNSSTQVDCSYDAASVEQITIPNAPPNAYYMLLITNFSTSAGFINLVNNSDESQLNCSIICQVDLGDDQEFCDGDSYVIEPDFTGAFNTFEWQLNGVTIPDETGSTLTVTESGTYTLIADGVDAIFGDDCTAEGEVVISITSPFDLNDIAISECSSSATSADFNLDAQIADIIDPLDPADYTVSFYNSLTDAETPTGAITDSDVYNGVDGEVMYVRVQATGTSCFSISTITLSVSPQPIINPAPDLSQCDDQSNDGLAEFDLSVQTALVLGSQAAADFTVSYHTSFADADSGDNALPLNYTNTVNSQPIYVRIANATDPSCYNASVNPVFNLIVNTRALATMPANMERCDDDSDGIETFDLSSQEAAILDTQSAATYNVTFHSSQSDADSGSAALPTSYTNTSSPNQQTIYARVEDPLFPDCYSTTSFDIVVNPLPTVIAPTALEVCDDGTPDGITEMDLSLKNTEITGNNPSYSVSYHEFPADAETGDNALPTLYTNNSNGQIIHVRVEDINTGCSATTTLELVVEQAPVAYTPQPLYYCDPDNDGFGVFNLAAVDDEITGGVSGLSVTYHETQTNANNGVDAIDTTVNYNNIVEDAQTLYVRVESETIATDCATLVILELIVEESPQLVAPTPLEVCDDISADGFAEFDLTSKAEELLNGGNPAQYSLTYYDSEANAEIANTPIANPLAYTNTEAFTQTIWVRVEDDTTVEGCYKITSLELIVNPLPVLITPAPLELCDVNNPGDEQEAFILEDANEEILNGQTGISLTHYETQADADQAINPIVSPYTNTENAQTIFVRAENDITGCYNTVTVTLRVDPIPSPEPDPEAIEVCDDDNDGFAEFDLSQRTVEITNGESDVEISYHETQSDAETGANPITGLYTNIVANTQEIYVRSENTLTGCYSLTSNTLELIVHPAPEVPTSLEPYTICDSDDDGVAQFDLTTKDEEVLNGQDAAAVTLTYHVSETDAEAGANPIINVSSYTNNGNPQTIYVRLYDPITTCYDTGEFELMVSLPPVAIQPTQLSECDDLGQVPGDEITV
ncbi:PKD domain-containing protein, partial [Winogradskyella vidalii]|uniref:PKD domain-containing protein n=1 Tax=Winogradskyella vidalii TaxID=2615024 RepID=UPI0015C7C03F